MDDWSVLQWFEGLSYIATVIGIPMGIFILMLYGFSLVFAKPMAALVIGKWIEHKSGMHWGKVMLYFVCIGVYIAIKVAVLIPILGWLAWFVVFLLTIGALKTTELKKIASIL